MAPPEDPGGGVAVRSAHGQQRAPVSSLSPTRPLLSNLPSSPLGVSREAPQASIHAVCEAQGSPWNFHDPRELLS